MRIRTRALVGALLSAALIAELPGSAVGATTGARGAKGTTGLRASSRASVIGVGVSAVPPTRIPVKEPPRLKAAVLPASAVRPKVVQAVRVTSGVRVNGLPMLRPNEIDRVLAAARRSSARSVAPAQSMPAAAPVHSGRPVPVAPGTHVARGGTRTAMSLPSDPNASGTGINPWWRYQEENVPGGGRVMVNVGTGNLLLQDDDMAVPHKGIAMAFRRTYNSQASAAVLSTAWGNFQSLYGNGWTNTFDARLVSQSATLKSVYDIDGARYDYLYNSTTGTMTSLTPGQHATMVFDGGCGWLWTKKSGTTYYFYTMNPNAAVTCPSLGTIGGYSGRLYQIIGRNRNTFITFHYSWDNGDASINGKISTITATTESGMNATLSFADVSGRRLLQQLTLPDNATSITYGYDAQGNLLTVSRPPNNASGTRPQRMYAYQTIGSDSEMLYAASPRWSASCAVGACGYDGGYLYFTYIGSSAATSTLNTLYHGAVVNPTIADGTNAVLQPGYQPQYANYSNFVTDYYTTGVATPTFRDTDGHMTNWVVDGLGRPTQTQECTASTSQGQQCTGTWLVTNEGWDANNNLTSTTDARGNETDYAYDANGNAVAVGEPLTSTSQGTLKPTKLYDYDGFNNVTAYCDETQTHAAGADWTSPPGGSDSLCTSHTVPHARFTFGYPSYEPYGQITTITTPMGYSRHMTYAAAQQAGNDYGLPTSVTGDSYTQLDNSSITPTQTFWYDASGNLRCYSKGQGTSVLSYDALGRMTSVADPDDSSANAGSLCGKSSGQSGWNTQTTYAYFPDGAKLNEQTPSERVGGVSSTFAYDLDGNEISETRHHGCSASGSCPAGITSKWYDGADRLVEVAQPHDPTDLYATAWLTRYLYDLQAGNTVTVSGTSFRAYGGLFDTQEYIPSGYIKYPPQYGATSWRDVRAQGFDAVDRLVAKYTFSPSANATLTKVTSNYDAGASTLGLLSSTVDPLGGTMSYTYDAAGRATAVAFSGDGGVTPGRTYVYDPDGRPAQVTSSVYGTQTSGYDADGRLVSVAEPSGGGFTSPATIGYDYYPDGHRKDLTVQSSAVTASPLMTYLYRADGERIALTMQYQGTSYPFTWSYSDAGRRKTQNDPYTGQPVPGPPPTIPAGTTFGPTQWVYGANGELASLAFPGVGKYSQISHDLEGAVASYHVRPLQSTDYTNSLGVNVRGEIIGQTEQAAGAPSPTPLQSFRNADGTQIATYQSFLGGPHGQSATYDPVNSVPISSASWTMNGSGLQCPNGNVTTETYDAASRHTATSVVSYDTDCTQAQGTVSSAYDAENHAYLMSSNGVNPATREYESSAFATGLGWGANGHPIVSTYTPNSTTLVNPSSTSLHYDGDAILFGTDQNGRLSFIRPELLGEYSLVVGNVFGPNHFAAFDRDFSGLLASAHSQSLFGGVDYVNGQYHRPKWTEQIQIGDDGGGSPFKPGDNSYEYIHADGFETFFGTIQGTRVSDSFTSTWTTPDAYAGDVHDPMSQKPFMWNRNNPYEYSDPSGYRVLRLDIFKKILERLQDGHWSIKEGSHGGATAGRFFTDAERRATTQNVSECPTCGDSSRQIQTDHVHARSQGGNTAPENRGPKCSFCNQSKGADTESVWVERMKAVIGGVGYLLNPPPYNPHDGAEDPGPSWGGLTDDHRHTSHPHPPKK